MKKIKNPAPRPAAKRKGQAVSPTRASFVRHFGEREAKAIEAAAQEHGNGINNVKIGSDAFRWALAIIIGYQCAEVKGYREHHKIKASWMKIKSWIKRHGDLANHNGDVDYISMFAGTYNEYIPKRRLSSPRVKNTSARKRKK